MTTVQHLVGAGFTASDANMLGSVAVDNLTATGTTQGTGYPITASRNRFTVVTGGVNDASTLPLCDSTPHDCIVIFNNSAGTLQVFPGVGEQINNNAVNTPGTMVGGTSLAFFKFLNRWVTR